MKSTWLSSKDSRLGVTHHTAYRCLHEALEQAAIDIWCGLDVILEHDGEIISVSVDDNGIPQGTGRVLAPPNS